MCSDKGLVGQHADAINAAANELNKALDNAVRAGLKVYVNLDDDDWEPGTLIQDGWDISLVKRFSD